MEGQAIVTGFDKVRPEEEHFVAEWIPDCSSGAPERMIQRPNLQNVHNSTKHPATCHFTILCAWALLGLFSFVVALWTVKRSGPVEERLAGLVLSLLLGPFYLLFALTHSSYCPRL
jgi:hypothetical protein